MASGLYKLSTDRKYAIELITAIPYEGKPRTVKLTDPDPDKGLHGVVWVKQAPKPEQYDLNALIGLGVTTGPLKHYKADIKADSESVTRHSFTGVAVTNIVKNTFGFLKVYILKPDGKEESNDDSLDSEGKLEKYYFKDGVWVKHKTKAEYEEETMGPVRTAIDVLEEATNAKIADLFEKMRDEIGNIDRTIGAVADKVQLNENKIVGVNDRIDRHETSIFSIIDYIYENRDRIEALEAALATPPPPPEPESVTP